MGCACTKSEVIGPGKNGLERRRSSNHDPNNDKKPSNAPNKSKFFKRSFSFKKPFTNILNEKATEQQKDTKLTELNESANKCDQSMLISSNNTNLTHQAQTTPTQDRLIQPGTKKGIQIGERMYSFLNLPTKTQNLLNAQHEFDSEFSSFLQSVTSIELNSLLKDFAQKSNANKEIQIYLSTSIAEENEMFTTLNSSPQTKQCYNINEVLFKKLATQSVESDYDLNFINFSTSKSSNRINKYYRRLLDKLIISDLLSITNSTVNNNFSTPGCFLFVIILSDGEFEDANDESSLLLSEEIEVKDYETYFKKDFNEREHSLFHKWYSVDKYEKSKYRLNDTNLSNLSSDLNELDELYHSVRTKYPLNEDDNNERNEESLSLKYLKSIQQDEIEFVVKHIDPSSIIWLNLTDSAKKNLSRFNQNRFQSVLKLLQSHVLAHNYKECQLSEIKAENVFSNFFYSSINALVDSYMENLSKKQNHSHILKIDQSLAQELLKHYEVYKYLRVKHEYLNRKKPKRSEVDSKFGTILNDYLKAKTKHPLLINNFKERPTYVTCDEIISKWISDSMASPKKNRAIIYRFCGQSIISSDISTLLQSIFQQVCYLLDIHESWSFDSVTNIIRNLSKVLEKENKEEKSLIIIIDRIDRILRSKYDQNIFLKLLDKVYNQNSVLSSSLKLVITYSAPSDLFSNLIQPVKDLFKTVNSSEMICYSLKSAESMAVFNFNEYLVKLKQKLYSVFKENNLGEANSLVDVLIELMLKSRYGLKQNEIFDLLRQSVKNRSVYFKISLDYCIQTLWYTFKNYSNIFKQINLIETLMENNQILYRLEKPYLLNIADEFFNDDLKIRSLLTSYFKTNIENPNGNLSTKRKLRAYQELSSIFLVHNHEAYYKSFVINYNWFINKQICCESNVLYFIHDIESFKRLLHLTGCSDISKEKLSIENEKDEYKLFEHLFYEKLYALHQDPKQIYNQFKAGLNFYLKMNKTNYLLTNMASNLDKHFKSTKTISNQISSLNYEYIMENEMPKIDKEKLTFNTLANLSTYLSKVMFLNKDTILALSDTQNEIKIWKINSTLIELIRSIKLNKTPRDLRLLNQRIAVVLVDRNLHLFDLNDSKHVLDMNSTMSANVPFFEIHDQNHVVLLARNRLSVILMKVSPPKQEPEEEEEEEKTAETKALTNTKTYSVDDDMFLFKVGEDRYLNSLLVSKNGQVMVCGDEVQKPFPLLVWNLDKRKLVYDLRQAKHEFITSIQSIGSKGKFVACACQEEGELKNCLVVYDLITGQMFKKLKSKSNYVAVEISEESSILIACLENAQIIVYDLESGSEKCTLNTNRFPANKIKMIDTNRKIFITYDTKGYDWTVRAWDLSKPDDNYLLSSFTCPARIISCSTNVDHLNTNKMNDSEEILIGLALYGIQQPLILKLNNQISNIKSQAIFDQESNLELFNKIDHFNKEINL